VAGAGGASRTVGSVVEFRILGPLEVVSDDGLVEVRGAKVRAVLALLLVRANHVVCADRLIEDLWDARPPASAAATLQTYVYQLRKSLPPDSLLTRPSGYMLQVAACELDALRFEHSLAEVTRCDDASPEWVAARLAEALTSWRGPALADWHGAAWAQPEAARLEGLRLAAIERLTDARLSLGEHASLVPELEAQVAVHPWRERLWGQLMLALYRSDRQADALRALGRLRRHLGEELGIEPGRELVRLEEAILSQRPELDWQPSRLTTETAVETLPSGVVTFLLSDIVGSMSLCRQHPETMEQAVARHHVLIHQAVSAHGGKLVRPRCDRDSTFSVFTRATDALAAAVSAQRALLDEAWPGPTPLSVRMALHTGEAFERDGDYYGPTVDRAARMRSRGAGGEILLSQATGEVVRDHLPEQAKLTDLGTRVLSEGARVERLWVLAAPGLPERATPGVATLDSPAGLSIPVPGVLRDAAGGVFVGREPELETLLRAWQDATIGQRSAVLVGGEPGVGKTRLAAELARIVAAEGAKVLYGRCDEDVGIPYQPWVEALRHLVVHEPRELLAEHVAEHGCELARLIPELAHHLGGLPPGPPGDPDMERLVLFGEVVGLLALVSSDTPVLLVLEDLHWADKPSLRLLRHVIASTDPRALLAVGTYRPTDLGPDHPLADVLAALHREPHARRVDLHGLSDTEVVALIEAYAGHAIDEAGVALAHALYQETDGNPFFTRELLRHLVETGAISHRDDGRWIAEVDFRDHQRLPTSVREVIDRRVAQLGDEAGQILRAAAVIGRDFELDLLAAVTDHSEDHLIDVLDTALRAVLIREVPHQPGRLSFSHALIEHTLYDDLGPTRRQRLHHRVAVALETLCDDDSGDRLGELAYHWSHACQTADAAKAVEYALRAGDHALAKLAPDDAVAWYGQALELIDRQSRRDERAHCEALVGLGIAQRHAGDPSSRDTLLRAADRARRLASPALLVRAVLASNRLGRASVLAPADQERVDTLKAALSATDGTATPERATLLATLAVELTGDDLDQARTLSDEALVMARRLDDDRTLCEVLVRRRFAIWSPATLDERIANAYELREATERLGDRALSLATAGALAHAATCRGDLVEVDKNLDVMIRLATETGFAEARWTAAMQLSWRRLLAGDIDAAEQAAVEALEIGSQAGEPNALPYFRPQIYAIRRVQGRVDELIEAIEGAASENPGLPAYRVVLVDALCSLDRLDDARVVLEPLAANGFTDLPFDIVWLTAMTWCADAAAALDDRAAASLLAELLAPWCDQLDFNGLTCGGSVARALGLALATAGRFDEADEAFTQAAAVHERIDAPIELARTQLDWAGMFARRAEPGDADRAGALLGSALTTADNLGLAMIQRQAKTMLSKLAAN
jgi:DNA-binding SARP family transcriptional activator/tetratricopeptide (TPR) repeat protein